MKEIIINSIFLLNSILLSLFFLNYVKKEYGRLPSISASAKHLKKDGNQVLFYLFITIDVCVPLAWIAQSWLSTIAAMLLFGIGIITGYNPNLKNNKWENGVHVFLTMGAITLFLLDAVLLNWWYAIPVGICLIWSGILWLKKAKDHTWKIEVIVLVTVWVVLGIDKILLNLF